MWELSCIHCTPIHFEKPLLELVGSNGRTWHICASFCPKSRTQHLKLNPFQLGWVAEGLAVCYKPNSNSYSYTSSKTSRRQSWIQLPATLFAVPCMWELSCIHCTPIHFEKPLLELVGSNGRTWHICASFCPKSRTQHLKLNPFHVSPFAARLRVSAELIGRKVDIL